MSASAVVIPRGGGREQPLFDLRDRRVLRYAVGSTLAMALALAINWPLSFISAVLSLGFLASPAPRPTLREGLVFVATIAVACYLGLWVSWLLIPYPVIFFPSAALMLLWLYHAKEGGAQPVLVTWLMIALLLLPMMALQTPLLASGLAGGLVVGAVVCIGLVWLAHGLIPDPRQPSLDRAPTKPVTPALPDAETRFRNALVSTAVVFPMLLLLYLAEASGALITLIFIAILSMQPAFAKNLKVGTALVLGNAMGGLAAILVYELLVIVPEFYFLVLLLLLCGLFFGARVFSDRKSAGLYKMAFSTLLLLTAMSTTSGDEVRSLVYSRVLLIMLAVVYVVLAFGVIDRLRNRKAA